MYHRIRTNEVSVVKQREDKNLRFDYGKVKVEFLSGLVGEESNIKDSR